MYVCIYIYTQYTYIYIYTHMYIFFFSFRRNESDDAACREFLPLRGEVRANAGGKVLYIHLLAFG